MVWPFRHSVTSSFRTVPLLTVTSFISLHAPAVVGRLSVEVHFS